MKTVQIQGSLRTETGKKFSKNIRRKEEVPAIIYGGKENVMLTLSERDLREIIFTPNVYLIDVKVDGNVYKTIVKDMQFHPVSDRVLHVDFLQVFDDKKVSIAIPVELVGTAEGSKAGGKLTLTTRKLRVSALPKHLPDNLMVDVTNLGLGKALLVGDLSFENLQIIDPKSTVIASVKLTRAARGAQAAASAEEKK